MPLRSLKSYGRAPAEDEDLMSQWLQESVQGFFSHLNWDNRPTPSAPPSVQSLPYMSVAHFMASIPWTGDPGQLSAHSLQQATAATWDPGEEEELSFTLADLSSLF